MNDLSAAVLAGGLSSRMGRDKALVELDGRPLVCHVVDRLRPVSDDVFVVVKRSGNFEQRNVRVVVDDSDVRTPLAGIAQALRAAACRYVFVCACDMPFVSPGFVELIAARAFGYDAAVPCRNGCPEPLHAVWSTDSGPAVEAALRAGERSVHGVLDRLRVAWIDEDQWGDVDPTGSSFENVNTPEDLIRVAERR